MRVLVVEDEPDLADVIRRGLEEARYVVDVALDGTEGLRLATQKVYAVILLDIMLPGLDGWEICRRLRANRHTTPILMLTARDALADRVRGLDLGADDYLPKPFEFLELLARVRALARRDRVNRARVIEVADVRIDTASRTVTRGGVAVALTNREYELLEALASREGKPLTREFVLSDVWYDDESCSNTVDVFISQLRRKLDEGRRERLIHTVHGVGYVLRADPPEHAN